MKYNNFIWDFGGTLFNTYPAFANQVVKILKENSIEEDYDYILIQAKRSKNHLIEELTKKYKLSKKLQNEIRKCEKYTSFEDRKPFEGIKDILMEVINSGGKNFIYTHRSFHSAMELLYYYGMFDYFVDIVSKDVGLERKPNPEGFIYILNKYDLDKSKTISIGDRRIDVESSKAAGINTAFFGNADIDADIVFEDFKELKKKLT